MATRIVGLGPAFRRNAVLAPKFVARNNLAPMIALARRHVQTESLPPSATQEILDAQRIRRPSSPHFTIYQPQLPWISSIFNRFTGAGLSTLLYGFTISYLVLPVVGAPFTSNDIVQLAALLPDSLKITAKALLAASFTFHSFNGLRHLGWDIGQFLTVKGAYAAGYTVIGASAIATIALLYY